MIYPKNLQQVFLLKLLATAGVVKIPANHIHAHTHTQKKNRATFVYHRWKLLPKDSVIHSVLEIVPTGGYECGKPFFFNSN